MIHVYCAYSSLLGKHRITLVITWEPVDGYRLNGESCPSSILRPPLSCFWRCALKTLYIPATQSARAQMHSPTAAVRGTFEGHEHVSTSHPHGRRPLLQLAPKLGIPYVIPLFHGPVTTAGAVAGETSRKPPCLRVSAVRSSATRGPRTPHPPEKPLNLAFRATDRIANFVAHRR